MVTVKDCAILSANVYNLRTQGNYDVIIEKYSQAKHKPLENGYAMITDVPGLLHPSGPFYSQLYVKFVNGQPRAAIIAFRGTVPSDIQDDYVDLVTWYSDVFGEGRADNRPPYLPITMGYYLRAYRYVREYFPSLFFSDIYVTGHSLGGALAQLIVMNGRPHPACVFNSPGVGHVPGAKLSDASYVFNINAKYGVINKIGLTLGALRYVDVPEDEKIAEALFRGFLLKDYTAGQVDIADATDQTSFLDKLHLIKEGLHEDLLAFLGSEKALADHEEKKVQNQYLQCESDHEKSGWLRLQSLLLPKVCDDLKMLELPFDTGAAIAAQHSIHHLLSALLEPKNSKIAELPAYYTKFARRT